MAIEFGGLLEEFTLLGVQVLGVSVDRPELHQAWASRRDVSICMIHDSVHQVSKAFGVSRRSGGIKHSTFLIDADGTIRKVYRVKTKGHAAAVLQECQTVWAPSGHPAGSTGGGERP